MPIGQTTPRPVITTSRGWGMGYRSLALASVFRHHRLQFHRHPSVGTPTWDRRIEIYGGGAFLIAIDGPHRSRGRLSMLSRPKAADKAFTKPFAASSGQTYS